MKPRAAFVLAAVLTLAGAAGCRKPQLHVPLSLKAAPPPDATLTAIRHDAGSGLVLAILEGRRIAIVADENDEVLRVVDLAEHQVIGTTPLGSAPGQMLLAQDGTLFVALRDAAQVVALRFRPDGTTREVARHDTGDEPFGLAITPDQKRLLVSSITMPRLEVFDAATLKSLSITGLPRDPRSILVAKDGQRAFVSHATGSTVSVVSLDEHATGPRGEVALGETEVPRFDSFSGTMEMTGRKTRKPMMTKSLTPIAPPHLQRAAVQGFALTRIDDQVLLPEALVLTSDGARISMGYGSIASSTLATHVPFVARFAESASQVMTGSFSGPRDRVCFEAKTECLVPRAVTDDGKRMFVACLDSDEVLVIDPKRDAEHAPACAKTIEERPRLAVDSPTAVAVDERGTVWSYSSFTHQLTMLGSPDAIAGTTVASSIPVWSTIPMTTEVAAGQRLFHQSGNRKISADGRACASCHVDGRDDGLVWPTPSGERQTPMLAGRLEGTAPYGWNGDHETVAQHIKQTIANLSGSGLSAEEIDHLAAYCLSMHAPVKHTPPSEAALATRGNALFHSPDTSCSTCHADEKHFTDGETHTLGSAPRPLDTPSLAFVGQTAPYFHDARFATLESLVDQSDGPHTKMGHTSQLSENDRRALVAYLRTL